MKDIKKLFRNLEQNLRQSSWFDDGWDIYNRGPYLQLYKENWYNQNQGGVHFETYIEAPQLQKKEFPVHMHAEEDCPQQQRFIEAFLALEADRIRNWKGYSVIGEGYNICSRTLPLNFKNLELRLFEEFNRLRQLEASIDAALNKVA
ncbi:hypothetical protein E8Q33_05110 [Methylophaga sp. SB9B]|uniref:hypothetical protein n=1 Tax=Methylophaga sp. SB9B TaxID=2570356 RepID=UPI0010A8CFD6|nr:hypothetical protein [Methylophaga sp. SB9B]THK42163.1 hypothetical protein E8Q33_05110 [Methylophaga sp. SB9B]